MNGNVYLKGYHIPEWNVTTAMLPKCASSSVKRLLTSHFGYEWRALGKNGSQALALVPAGEMKGRVITAVRHPLDRFESLWRQKCRDHGGLSGFDKGILYGLSPEALWEFTQENSNYHWSPQAELVRQINPRAEVHIVPLDELDTAWAALVPGAPKLDVCNSTEPGEPMPPELQHKILDRYADDVDLYEDSFNWRKDL